MWTAIVVMVLVELGWMSLTEALCVAILLWLMGIFWLLAESFEHFERRLADEMKMLRYNEIYPSLGTIEKNIERLREKS